MLQLLVGLGSMLTRASWPSEIGRTGASVAGAVAAASASVLTWVGTARVGCCTCNYTVSAMCNSLTSTWFLLY
jgi:hypothetical protein